MADIGAGIGADAAVTFMVSGGIVYEIVAAACSSPQTTEINADTRADTLMKWVYLGLGQAVIFVAVTALIAKKTGGSPGAAILGGGLAGLFMWMSYAHAKRAGLESDEAPTET